MKKMIAFFLILSVSSIFAGTDIVYNQGSTSFERIVAGNIFFDEEGWVAADKVCFSSVENVFKTTIPSKIIEKCSEPNLPVWKCTEEGFEIIKTKIPAKNIMASRKLTSKECAEYDYSDSMRPRCVSYVSVEKLQPADFEFLKYKVEVDEHYAGHKYFEVRDMKSCN